MKLKIKPVIWLAGEQAHDPFVKGKGKDAVVCCWQCKPSEEEIHAREMTISAGGALGTWKVETQTRIPHIVARGSRHWCNQLAAQHRRLHV